MYEKVFSKIKAFLFVTICVCIQILTQGCTPGYHGTYSEVYRGIARENGLTVDLWAMKYGDKYYQGPFKIWIKTKEGNLLEISARGEPQDWTFIEFKPNGSKKEIELRKEYSGSGFPKRP